MSEESSKLEKRIAAKKENWSKYIEMQNVPDVPEGIREMIQNYAGNGPLRIYEDYEQFANKDIEDPEISFCLSGALLELARLVVLFLSRYAPKNMKWDTWEYNVWTYCTALWFMSTMGTPEGKEWARIEDGSVYVGAFRLDLHNRLDLPNFEQQVIEDMWALAVTVRIEWPETHTALIGCMVSEFIHKQKYYIEKHHTTTSTKD